MPHGQEIQHSFAVWLPSEEGRGASAGDQAGGGQPQEGSTTGFPLRGPWPVASCATLGNR